MFSLVCSPELTNGNRQLTEGFCSGDTDGLRPVVRLGRGEPRPAPLRHGHVHRGAPRFLQKARPDNLTGSRMVLDLGLERSPEPGSLEHDDAWPNCQPVIEFRDDQYPHAEDLLAGMADLIRWLEEHPAGRKAIRSALARPEREIAAELELEERS